LTAVCVEWLSWLAGRAEEQTSRNLVLRVSMTGNSLVALVEPLALLAAGLRDLMMSCRGWV
jgi:hypothetical protein